MSSIKKIIPFAKPYKKYAYLNIFFNVLYALFSTLSFIALIPMIDVLFDQTKRNVVKPIYKGLFAENFSIKTYLTDSLSYFVTTTTDEFGPGRTLSIMVAFIISIFLLKNICDYLAMFFI